MFHERKPALSPPRVVLVQRAAMHIARTRDELRALLADLPVRALVPTMGALHEGHLALVAAARRRGPVIASIFVNPTQFAAGEDLSRYPRDEAGDLDALRGAGCAVAFLPDVTEMYPNGHATAIEVLGPALRWEGARRPTHFRGVATVVARLFGLTQPGTAWFGEKDWQQLQVVRRMTRDLALGVEIAAMPTVRDADGLALSSRNRYLSADQRALAAELPRSCRAALAAMASGENRAAACAAARARLTHLGFAVDYLAVVHGDSLEPDPPAADPARLIVAAGLGTVRLLDNFPV